MDFATLPPEINSARMYSGQGPGPMLAAAAAWDGLAIELHSTAASYASAISALTSGDWQGPSAASMAAAAGPYVAWMRATAAQAEQTAAQAKAAVAAYETAFAATVPPPVIAANRALLMTLIATNILGQNTAAIAATEAHYAEMWAQDAAAMFGYAGSSAAATRLTPFTSPPKTTNDGGVAAQSAAVAQATGTAANSNAHAQLSHLISMVPTTLQGLATTTSTSGMASLPSGLQSGLSSIAKLMSDLTGAYSPIGLATLPGGWWLTSGQILKLGQNGAAMTSLLGGSKPITGALAPLAGVSSATPAPSPAGLGGGAVSGAMGRANLVGGLSVPASWASAAPAVRTLAAALPGAGLGAAPTIAAQGTEGLFGPMALSSLAGRALGGTAARSVGGTAPHITGGAVADGAATEATIIVIPPAEK